MINIFGTDGIRGKANSGYLTPDYIIKIAISAAAILKNNSLNHHSKVLIGKDTRLSGYLFETALTAGFTASGVDVLLVGPMPTPAISMLTKSMRADFGIMISASHNPYYDNGIKIFDKNGHKITYDQQKQISEMVINETWSNFLSPPNKLGKAKRIDDAPGRYVEFVKSSFQKDITLDGLKVVIDCANGAAYQMGPTILAELGAETIAIGNNPNGFNINHNCGSTSPEMLIENVLEHKADIGIALDGDADRLIIVDEKGGVVNGDMIIAMIAKHLKNNNLLSNKKIVVTNMTNISCEKYITNELDLEVIRTDVGDTKVMEEMVRSKTNLGGEQSGHIIMSDFCQTGDGLIASLQILAIMVKSKDKLSNLSNLFVPYPQKITNVAYHGDNPLINSNISDEVNYTINKYKENDARIIVRKSGTEKLIRIMVEAKDETIISNATEEIAKIINSNNS